MDLPAGNRNSDSACLGMMSSVLTSLSFILFRIVFTVGGDVGQRGPFYTGARCGERRPRVFEGMRFDLLFSRAHGASGKMALLTGSHRVEDKTSDYFKYLEAIRLGRCNDTV